MKLTFFGDIMLDNIMSTEIKKYYNKKNNKYDFFPMFEHMVNLTKKSDYVIANLETPISYDNSDLTDMQWQFYSPYEFALAVKKMGVDYVSTANNHCLDRGIAGIESTLKTLDEIGLNHSGTYNTNTERKNVIVEKNGLRFGVLSYTYGTNAVTNLQYLGRKNRRCVDLIQEQEGYIDLIDPFKKLANKRILGLIYRLTEKIKRKIYPNNKNKQWYEKETIGIYRKHLLLKDLKYLRKNNVDFVIMCLHIGGQYNKEPSSYTLKTVEWLLKHNVNIVIGNHEHVIHNHRFLPLKGQFATYAIGNFIGSAGTLRVPYDRRCDYSIAVHIYYDESTDKKLKKVTFSVLKTVLIGGKLSVWPVYDLLKSETNIDNELIISDSLFVAKEFSDINYGSIEEEFLLYEA